MHRISNDDLDAELDKMSKDIIGYDNKKYEFDTVDDWLDSIVFSANLHNDNVIKVLSDMFRYVSLNIVGGLDWFTSIKRLKRV